MMRFGNLIALVFELLFAYTPRHVDLQCSTHEIVAFTSS